MLYPSYQQLIDVANENSGGATNVVNSRYSIVMATSKRARQIIDGSTSMVDSKENDKPLSVAIEEIRSGKVKILGDEN